MKIVTFKLPLSEWKKLGKYTIQKLFRGVSTCSTEKGSGQNI